MRKKKWKLFLFSGIYLFTIAASAMVGWTAAAYFPQVEVSAEISDEDSVLVGGMPIGIYLETDGILVLDTQSVEGMDGVSYEPAQNVVRSGDYIIGINQETVQDKEELITSLKQLKDENVVLKLKREEEVLEVKLEAVETAPYDYKLGIWVRDNAQGLGTITFVDKNSRFGALGHGIHDTDTNVLMNISAGSLYKTSIRSIVKGETGIPGSMEGLIIYNTYNRIGSIDKNTETGIYGTVEELDKLYSEQTPVEMASSDEIEVGEAKIRCYVDETVKEYSVRITDLNPESKEVNKRILLQVTDSELLEKTGGIVQGMSGSPILQNGKLIGAVTHVFVNDPTKGYGILIENMLEQ